MILIIFFLFIRRINLGRLKKRIERGEIFHAFLSHTGKIHAQFKIYSELLIHIFFVVQIALDGSFQIILKKFTEGTFAKPDNQVKQ